jgi:hypothetical protein
VKIERLALPVLPVARDALVLSGRKNRQWMPIFSGCGRGDIVYQCPDAFRDVASEGVFSDIEGHFRTGSEVLFFEEYSE